MRVGDRLRRSAVGVECDATIKDAACTMYAAGVGALVVLDGECIVGIVTDRDLVRRAMAHDLPGDARVDAVMTTDVVSVGADSDIHEVFDVFRTHAIRRVAVVDGDRLVGVLSIDDLLIDLSHALGALAQPIIGEVVFGHRDSAVPMLI